MENLSSVIKIKPFKHQLSAASFCLQLFGAGIGGDANTPLMRSQGAALLMEM